MIQRNPTYTFLLFDDADMDTWIRDHTSKEIQACYAQLAVGAAKADLWRYLVLYEEGGIYLDIDSYLPVPFDVLITATDEAAVSRERNLGLFLQWFIAFKKGHAVLKHCIDIVIGNIQSKATHNVGYLTGPGPFTQAINDRYTELLPVCKHMWYQDDSALNPYTDAPDVPDRCRFIGTDFGYQAVWKTDDAQALYTDAHPHWMSVSTVFNAPKD
jgi:mannosyltransferase OCH1-like enzyme